MGIGQIFEDAGIGRAAWALWNSGVSYLMAEGSLRAFQQHGAARAPLIKISKFMHHPSSFAYQDTVGYTATPDGTARRLATRAEALIRISTPHFPEGQISSSCFSILHLYIFFGSLFTSYCDAFPSSSEPNWASKASEQ